MKNFSDKKFISILIVFIIIPVILVAWWWFKPRPPHPETLCRASNGGWAPVGPIEYAPIGADGKRLTADSPLIDRSEDVSGYTCWCHTLNTGWNGTACVPIPEN